MMQIIWWWWWWWGGWVVKEKDEETVGIETGLDEAILSSFTRRAVFFWQSSTIHQIWNVTSQNWRIFVLKSTTEEHISCVILGHKIKHNLDKHKWQLKVFSLDASAHRCLNGCQWNRYQYFASLTFINLGHFFSLKIK